MDELLLHGVRLFVLQTDRRQERPSLFLLDAEDDIAATPIIDIISESANRMDEIFRVPAGFEFDPLPFDRPAADQVLDVYGKGHSTYPLSNLAFGKPYAPVRSRQ